MTEQALLDLDPQTCTHISQGLKLSYVDWGPKGAPLVVLVHGSRDHARTWDWTARELLKDGWRVVAPDLRGHGDSDWSPDGAYLSSYHLLDLANLFDHLGEERFSLLGHSLGGNISVRYAAMYPERIRRLVLVDGIGPAPHVFEAWRQQGPIARSRDFIDKRRAAAGKTPPMFASLQDAGARMAAANPHLTPEQVAHLTRHGAKLTETGWTWKADIVTGIHPPEDFGAETSAIWDAVACPTLLFWGGKSWTTNPETDGRGQHFKDHKTVAYMDAGHWPHHERFADFAAELRAFLK